MINNIYKFKILESKKLIHGVSSKLFGSIKNNGIINKKNLKKFLDAMRVDIKTVIFPEQVHGSRVVAINDSKKNYILNADGLITNKKNVFLGIVTADCLPVIFYDNKTGIIGIAHAGYKGLLSGIVEEMLKVMKKMGADVENMKIAIGPAIGVCCYEVSQEIRKGKYFLDLKNIAKQSLMSEGVAESNIEVSDICTKDNVKDFYSFRGEGPKNFGEFATIVG